MGFIVDMCIVYIWDYPYVKCDSLQSRISAETIWRKRVLDSCGMSIYVRKRYTCLTALVTKSRMHLIQPWWKNMREKCQSTLTLVYANHDEGDTLNFGEVRYVSRHRYSKGKRANCAHITSNSSRWPLIYSICTIAASFDAAIYLFSIPKRANQSIQTFVEYGAKN